MRAIVSINGVERFQLSNTSQISPATANLSANVPEGERDLYREAAARRRESMGAFLRRILLRGLEMEEPDLALKLRAIRTAYYGAALCALFLCATLHAVVAGDDDRVFRRARRGASIARRAFEERVREEVVA